MTARLGRGHSASVDPVDLSAERTRTAAVNLLRRRRHERLRAAIRWVMSNDRGRYFVRHVLSVAGVDDDTFAVNSAVHARTAGRRSVALDIIASLKDIAFQEYATMIQEEHNDRTADTTDDFSAAGDA